MNEKYLNFLKKSWKIIVAVLFALAIALGLLQRVPNQYSLQNKSAESGGTADEFWAFYNKARELAPPKPEQKSSASFLAVGDIMLSRNVAAESFKALDVELPFRKMKDTLLSTDFNFGNLESPFFAASHPCSVGPGTMEGIVGGHSLIFGAPCNMRAGLKNYNFKILSLANNHALDQGLEGLQGTISDLNDLGIKHIGTGNNEEEAWQPAAIEANGIKICFIGASYASLNDGGKTTNDYVARIENIEKLKSSILNLKSACDFIVASMHAGTEYVTKPNQDQVNFAHAAIDAGADMVIGHHPHWVQTIERYCPSPPEIGGAGGGMVKTRNTPSSANAATPPLQGESTSICPNPKYIFYSLGNFIFDQMWSQETREGLVLKIRVSKEGCHPDRLNASEGVEGSLKYQSISDSSTRAPSLGMTCGDELQGPRLPARLEQIELIPVIIENYSTPRPADEKETKKLLERIGQTATLLYP
jgi:poly-gamma-glutamate capsule biosynthesis protein CapA/YwtB (metallophosphatase superfamily)